MGALSRRKAAPVDRRQGSPRLRQYGRIEQAAVDLGAPVYLFHPPRRESWTRYCWIAQAFSEAECERIIALGRAIGTATGTVDNSSSGGKIRESRVAWIENRPESDWIFAKLGELAQQVNRERYHLDLTGFTESLQYTEYPPDGHYNWHQDFASGTFSIRKLSQVVLLSDPADFEGGALEFFNDKGCYPNLRGTVVMFPSFEFHRVVPVTLGLRCSLVSWVSGPPFR